MQKGIKTRLIIHQILEKLKYESYSFDELLNIKIKEHSLSQRDKNLIQTVVLNSMRYKGQIDKIIKNFVLKKTNKQQYLLLLSAITQIVFLEFKDYAVVNSSVELAKLKKISAYPGFINAILKKISKNKLKFKDISGAFNDLPKWFCKEIDNWNTMQKQKFVDEIIKKPNLHIVFKNNKTLKKFNLEHIKTSEKSIMVNNHKNISDLPNYNKGDWWVQDMATMLPIHLTTSIKNKKILDMCAAPGGKSFQILSLESDLTMIEVNKQRSKILKKNLTRLNYDNNIVIGDVLNLTVKKKYDLIILDSPCTSVGTIRRNPEIFFRNNEPNIKAILNLQKKLLNKSKKLLNKNGIIIYMVCSFLEIETIKQINTFLSTNSNFVIEKFFSSNKFFNKLIDKNGFINTAPSTTNNVRHDGFFAAKIKNVK